MFIKLEEEGQGVDGVGPVLDPIEEIVRG